MAEYRFGISVTPYAEQYPQNLEQVLAAEKRGLDLVGIQDHPYQRRFLDTYGTRESSRCSRRAGVAWHRG